LLTSAALSFSAHVAPNILSRRSTTLRQRRATLNAGTESVATNKRKGAKTEEMRQGGRVCRLHRTEERLVGYISTQPTRFPLASLTATPSLPSLKPMMREDQFLRWNRETTAFFALVFRFVHIRIGLTFEAASPRPRRREIDPEEESLMHTAVSFSALFF
jgi:hypothetical protein